MWKEFKEFALKGSVMDLAVGVIIGAAFGKIVTSFVNDIIMPLIGLLLGSVSFNDLFVVLKGGSYKTLADAVADGAVTWNYGNFINAIVDFLIIAFVIFIVVKQINRLRKQPAPAAPAPPSTKECPHCFSTISIKATRCPNCTSDLS